ncbi:MAG: GNAT family protein [Bacteroidales bacterium]
MNTFVNLKVFNKFPVLESERLLFRKFEKKDAPALYAIRSNQKVMQYMDTIIQTDISDAIRLIKSNQDDFKTKTGINWAIVLKSNQQLIGSFSFWRLILKHCRAEIGYSIDNKYWGNGIMSETFNSLIPFGFDTLGLHSIEANVNPDNQRSIGLLEKFGFRREAYFRENYLYKNTYLDSLIFSLLEGELKKI